MRTIEFKMERQGLVNKGDKVKIIDRIKSEYGIVKDIRENSRGFYVIVDFDEDEPR